MWDKWEHHSTPGVFQRYRRGIGNGDDFYREKVQDIAPILDHNTKERNETDGRTPGGMRKVGSIPSTVYYEWVAEWTAKGLIGPGNMAGLNDLVIARLRDGNFSKFRTTNGGI